MAGNFFAKAIGLTALGIAGFDTFAATQRQSAKYVKAQQLKRLEDVYLRTDSLDNTSTVTNGMHKWARNWYMHDNWLIRMKDTVGSYVSGLFDNFSDNLTTFALGAVALFTGRGKMSPIKIPFVNKIAALLLAVKASHFVLSDLFGVGKIDPKKGYF